MKTILIILLVLLIISSTSIGMMILNHLFRCKMNKLFITILIVGEIVLLFSIGMVINDLSII